jgi:hypothetical protein
MLGVAGLAMQPAFADAARIRDIEISRQGEAVKILVSFSGQPTGAGVRSDDRTLQLDVDGLTLTPLDFATPPGRLVTHVAVETLGEGQTRVSMNGARFGETQTTIYRDAILIETTLLEQPPAAPQTQGADRAGIAPLQGKEIERVTTLAQLDDADCTGAALTLKVDPWSLPALGDHALCLIDAGQTEAGRASLDQLASFSPEDWRAALGAAALAAHEGDASKAEIGYRNAAMLAPDAPVRQAIKDHISALKQ